MPQILFFPLDKARLRVAGINLSFFRTPRAMQPLSPGLDFSRGSRLPVSLSMQFVRYMSVERSSPVSILWRSPLASLFATTSRTPTRLSAERARRSGRGNLPFLLLVRAAAIATTWGCARSSRLRLLRLAQVVTVRPVRGTLLRGAHLVPPGKNTLTFIAFSLRAQLVIDSHFRARVDPLRSHAASRSLDRNPKVDRAI